MLESLPMDLATVGISLVAIILSMMAVTRRRPSSKADDVTGQKVVEKLIFEQEKRKRMDERVSLLEEELATLKDEMTQLRLQNEESPQKSDSYQASFLNSLQFHTFIQKHKELIVLLQDGVSAEQAAKLTGKSIGEAQMIEAVMKQMKGTKQD